MKRIVLICIFIFNILVTFADGLTVISFTKSVTDLSARTNPRLDNSGNNCSLIKVLFSESGLYFEGDIIGNVRYEYESSTYWVYVSEKAELIVARHLNGDPLVINFGDFNEIKKIESNATYILQLQLDKYDYKVTYTPNHSGVSNGHQYVDLGLSVMWAACNLNAKLPEEGGKRYAWGEVSSKYSFTPENYKYKGSDEWNFSKYNDVDKKNELVPSDDAAHVIWGESWRMPTMDELIELYNSCTFIFSTYNNVTGFIVTGPSGGSIFLPIVDYGKFYQKEDPNHAEVFIGEEPVVSYMTSTRNDIPDPLSGHHIEIVLGEDITEITLGMRSEGCYIRPVCNKK